ncbi:hypothetical protein [Sphingomonas jatrophae]|uniref:Uncharacterized protein n=1 Tax=Sphingomonas jatrophae TaxID=1166337 RepID=A0A1I6LE66_9SPHN|nr:hypothetical protein [Sphingomonas jatrophae]SFS01704.1 hypothetical protein SAMN05192580_2630 [Sphingomonas jatrophae]
MSHIPNKVMPHAAPHAAEPAAPAPAEQPHVPPASWLTLAGGAAAAVALGAVGTHLMRRR